jgi:hypothetical protein
MKTTIPRSFIVLIGFFLCFVVACKKNTQPGGRDPLPPTPVTPVTPILSKYQLLQGWWKATQTYYPSGSYFVSSKIYFDSSGFYFQNVSPALATTATGKWSLIPTDSLVIELTAGWASPTVGKTIITKLTKDSLVFKLGTIIASYTKFDSAAFAAPSVSTIAGMGTSGYSGDGGPALSAQIQSGPLSTDGAGNIYVFGSNRVRKINVATGLISTVAGSGFPYYSGDGAPALNAGIASGGMAVDAAGNVYLTDYSNHVIRKIDAATGMINRIAGTANPFGGFSGDDGAAINAKINGPSSPVVDASGNLYFVDTQNRRIRKINTATGIITTVAGNGNGGSTGDGGPALQAALNTTAIAVDGSGNLLALESNNYKLRRINMSTGMITTIAGTGVKGNNGEGVSALSAKLNEVLGICSDASGNIYLGESFFDCRIRKISVTDNKIYTFAGTGFCGYTGDGSFATAFGVSNPGALHIDAKGYLYFSDEGRIRKIKTN